MDIFLSSKCCLMLASCFIGLILMMFSYCCCFFLSKVSILCLVLRDQWPFTCFKMMKESLSLMKESRFAENLRRYWFYPLCHRCFFLYISIKNSTLARVHGHSCSVFSCYSIIFPKTVDEMIKLEWGLQKSCHRGGYRS